MLMKRNGRGKVRNWRDINLDGVADEGEFTTPEKAGFDSISLAQWACVSDVGDDGTVSHGMIALDKTGGLTVGAKKSPLPATGPESGRMAVVGIQGKHDGIAKPCPTLVEGGAVTRNVQLLRDLLAFACRESLFPKAYTACFSEGNLPCACP